MKIETKILNLVLQVRGNLPTVESWRFVRYLNAVHLLGYIGLSHTYTVENFFDPMNKIHHFLSEDEVRRVKMIGADAHGAGYRELLCWSLEILNEGVRSGKLKDKLMGNMVKEIMLLHEMISSLYDFGDQPIPFVYIHLIFFLCLIYLPLFSYSIAVNMTLNYLKKRGRYAKVSLDYVDSGIHHDPDFIKITAANRDTVREVNIHELRKKLNEAMQKLSEDHRTVVTLYDIQGLQHNEISKILGVSEGTVRSRLFYAHRLLQT